DGLIRAIPDFPDIGLAPSLLGRFGPVRDPHQLVRRRSMVYPFAAFAGRYVQSLNHSGRTGPLLFMSPDIFLPRAGHGAPAGYCLFQMLPRFRSFGTLPTKVR